MFLNRHVHPLPRILGEMSSLRPLLKRLENYNLLKVLMSWRLKFLRIPLHRPSYIKQFFKSLLFQTIPCCSFYIIWNRNPYLLLYASYSQHCRKRISIVSITTAHWPDDRRFGVRVHVCQEFSLVHLIQNDPVAHLASYSILDPFLRG
jgi:hypothetical protein